MEGEDRLCWTMAGLNKLIALGLWRREFDARGNLKTKAPTVMDLMRVARPRLAGMFQTSADIGVVRRAAFGGRALISGPERAC